MARVITDDEILRMFAAHRRSGIGSTVAIRQAVTCDPRTARRYQATFTLVARYHVGEEISNDQWREIHTDPEFAPLRGAKKARELMSGVARACSLPSTTLRGQAAAEDHYQGLCALCDRLRALVDHGVKSGEPMRIVRLTGFTPNTGLVADEGLFGDEAALLPALQQHAPGSAAWPDLGRWAETVSEYQDQSERLRRWIATAVAREHLDRPGGAALLLERWARYFARGTPLSPDGLGPTVTTRDGTHELLQIGALMMAQSPLGTAPPDAEAVLAQLLGLRDSMVRRHDAGRLRDLHRQLRDLAAPLGDELRAVRLDGFPGTCEHCGG